MSMLYYVNEIPLAQEFIKGYLDIKEEIKEFKEPIPYDFATRKSSADTFKFYLEQLDQLAPTVKNVSFTIFKRLMRRERKNRGLW